MNPADTAWIIVATALVLFMTLPGLALFYGGLGARAQCIKRVYAMLSHRVPDELALVGLRAIQIAFGPADSGFWGGLDKAFLAGVDAESLSGTLPEVLFFAFQMTFRNHHSGLDRWGLCRADRICLCSYFFGPLDADLLRAGCPLDLGRWL